MKKIKYNNVLFDLDDTLFDYHLSERFALKKAFSFFNVNIDDNFEEIYKKYRLVNKRMWKKWEKKCCSDLSVESFYLDRFDTFFKELNINLPVNEFIKIYNQFSSTPYLIEGAEFVCESISKFANIFIVSNGPKKVRNNKIEKSTISQYISESFFSEIIGYNKPDINYFNYIFERIPNFSPRSTIIVGDRMETDILGGIISNIDTCLFVKKSVCLKNYNYVPDYVIGKLSDLVSYIVFEEE